MKKLAKWAGITIVALAFVLGILLIYVSTALPNVDPAPDLTVEVTQERVERGRYLTHNVMACVHCHTPQEKSKLTHPIKEDMLFAGGTLFGTEEGFPGNYYAPNLTPVNLGNWTDGEIYRAITTGVSKNGRALFPIMPYQRYALVDQDDIFSIIAYLRTVEPVEHDVPASESFFPMNFLINTIPSTPPPAPAVDRMDPVAYGKYLTNAASCIDCHTPKEQGADLPGMTFAGGMEFTMVDGSITRTANLTPDMETGIGSWTEEQFLNRFRMYADPSFDFHEVAEGSFNTAMPWGLFSKMSEEELKAIYAYLRTVEPVTHAVEKFTPMYSMATE